MTLERFSEPYNATGSLAAVGVLNQLGRPDVEPLEVLVREAIQNCWDAKRKDVGGIQVEIGRTVVDAGTVDFIRSTILVDPPPGLGLDEALVEGMQTLYFADFGTHGLGGPTRADQAGDPRDFVDFVRNIGQPPDKDFGGGSFGYGKAAFYIASRAHTIILDTLCESSDGRLERRLIGCALGDSFEVAGRPYTGRHWWGQTVDGTPEPVTGERAAEVAHALGLPDREGPEGMGTTVMVVASGLSVEASGGTDETMQFIAEALPWNFWPRMIDSPSAVKRTIRFRVLDNGSEVRIPNPRTHPRLRGFVEAMDRHRLAPDGDDELVLDREIKSLRPLRTLGRLTIQKGPVAPPESEDRVMPQGARATAASVHHVALMRAPEIVVKYLPGMAAVNGKLGYSGVFKCSLDIDDAFKAAEPPTHDDWVYRFIHDRQQRSFVKIALDRVLTVCREAAGYGSSIRGVDDAEGIPLGEFADSLAALMPGSEGPGARRRASSRTDAKSRQRRRRPGHSIVDEARDDVWVDGNETGSGALAGISTGGAPEHKGSDFAGNSAQDARTRRRPPQLRRGDDPCPVIRPNGAPAVRYPFELRANGNPVRLLAAVEVMTNDGAQVESEAPLGYVPPQVLAWTDPSGREYASQVVTVAPDVADGLWNVDVEFRDDTMVRLDITTEVA
ncbi:hypothetical protein [Mycobacterium colombiense]|nr:hypothetical protein [Mycobacterium colombiense]